MRLKVSSNSSGSTLLGLDVVSAAGGVYIASLAISPNLFRNSNEWQLFSLAVTIPDNLTDVEIRGMGFTGGLADLSLDYVNIIPGDIRGTYTNEFTVIGKGYVGVGTRSPDQLLTVNGGVHAKEVKVDVNIPYPDYVFRPLYRLPSLPEVESYIKKNHHLSEVPSEQEAKSQGLNLGDMNVLLVKKVEELTLYLIEKDKQLAEQGKKMKAQGLRLERLEKSMKRMAKNHD